MAFVNVERWTVSLLALSTLAASASAPAGHAFQAPGSGDVRSPCPGLNSLANHGFLPRNGKAISVADIVAGSQDGLNVGLDFASSVGLLGLQSSPNPLATTFDLNDLDEHNFPIEHDGSLSRQDYYEGDDHTFNQTIFDEVLEFYAGMTSTSIPVASKARYARIQSARAKNPTFIYGVRQVILSYGETALYLSVMGDPITGVAPLTYVESFFEQERLPYELGWTPPNVTTTLVTLGAMITQLQLANPDAAAEGLSLGEGTYRDVIELINPLTGKVENATCILANTC